MWDIIAYFFVVVVYPGDVKRESGENAFFICTATTHQINETHWIINDTRLEDLELMNVTTNFSRIGLGVGDLYFNSLPIVYNMTKVQCTGIFSSGQGNSSSNVVYLYVDHESNGMMIKVNSLHGNA